MGSTAYTTIVLVTGANTGLGWQISRKLATEHKDYHIIMTGRNQAAIERAVADLQSQDPGLTNIEPLVLDVTSDASIAAAVQTVAQKHGRLDVLVNNAGTTADNGNPAGETDFSRGKWEMVFGVNVFGAAAVTDAFVPLLEKSRAPARRVVFMTSSLGSVGMLEDKSTPWRGSPFRIYSASKAALNMLVKQYAVEHEGDPRWKFNACCPGHCATNLNGGTGSEDPAMGAVNAARLATEGVEGETGTFTNRFGRVPW